MGWLRRSSRIGFVIAGIAAMVFVAAVAFSFMWPGVAANQGGIAIGGDVTSSQVTPKSDGPASPILDASLTVIISGVTCLVSTMGAFSTMLLSWRLDRCQSRETELRIAQLQIEVGRSRQISPVKVEQS